jgi:hypothetical protein
MRDSIRMSLCLAFKITHRILATLVAHNTIWCMDSNLFHLIYPGVGISQSV